MECASVLVVVHDYDLFCTCLDVLGASHVRVICEPDRARAAARLGSQRPALVVVDTEDSELEHAAQAAATPVVHVRPDGDGGRARLEAAVRNVAARQR